MAVLAIVFAAAFAQRNASWGAEVAASYARGGTFDGPGVAAQVLWAPNDWIAVGPMVDIARLSSGPLAAGNGPRAAYDFNSTLAAGPFELRYRCGSLEPYAGLGLGYVAVDVRRNVNTGCQLGSGFGGLLGGGARAPLGDRVAVGVRASARLASFEGTCLASASGASFDMMPVLFELGGTLAYRW